MSLKADYRVAKTALLDRFKTAGNVDAAMRALARATDDALRRAWLACEMPASLALVAVGGYGRGELSPYSDIDILVLLHETPGPELEARIERFIGMAWDLGLELGSSVRTVDECIDEGERDITVRTSLLEARRITGSTALFQRFALPARGVFSASKCPLGGSSALRTARSRGQKMTSPFLRRVRSVCRASSRMSFAAASERRSFT